MPIFEYICKDCGKAFEAILHGSQQAACPSCSGANLEQQISAFAVSTAKAFAAPSSERSPCGTCGDPRGPGACSLD